MGSPENPGEEGCDALWTTNGITQRLVQASVIEAGPFARSILIDLLRASRVLFRDSFVHIQLPTKSYDWPQAPWHLFEGQIVR